MVSWITSDHHFGHAAIIGYCGRPFRDIETMDDVLVDNWNLCVAPDDTVFHLGDLTLGNKRKAAETIVPRLNGRIVLIRGNHDWRTNRLLTIDNITEIHPEYSIEHCGVKVSLIHDPMAASLRGPLICGHVHNAWRFKLVGEPIMRPGAVTKHRYDVAMNVSVDVWGFRPIRLSAALDTVVTGRLLPLSDFV